MVLFIFDYHWYDDIPWYEAMGFSTLEVLGYMLIFYLNYWIIKKMSKNWSLSIISSMIIIALYVIAIRFSGLEAHLYEFTDSRNLFSIILNSSLFTGLAYLISSIEKNIKTQEKNLQLASQNKQLELDSLKSRINPHFIFNTLNNMNALIVKKDERLPTYLSKLSGVLRYSVDSGSQKLLPLKNEINYLNDYLELIKMQEPASEDIDFYIEGELENLKIIPFVLMTLLENAVKHGDITHNKQGHLHLNISIDENFSFELSNSFSTKTESKQGIGLNNINKQMDLIYGDDYKISSRNSNGIYTTILQIELSRMQAS